jgi:hypothetical protein
MKKICYFDKKGNLINIGEWDYQYEIDGDGNSISKNPLPDGSYSEEKNIIINSDGEMRIEINPITEAEKIVGQNFTTLQLLQMKIWWDEIPHDSVPKLKSVNDWVSSITKSAIQGNTEFTNPPHSFQEILEECAQFL